MIPITTHDRWFNDFVMESNRIENITRFPTLDELSAHLVFLRLKELTAHDVSAFVRVVAPAGQLRCRAGMNVTVGDHRPPSGGPEIIPMLTALLERAMANENPYEVHIAYETLHPYMDGNGRSGRALWLWMMLRQGGLEYVRAYGFLRSWYYRSLSKSRIASHV